MDIPAGEFKAKCLKLMDQIERSRETITITKRGRPVARLIPIAPPRATRLFGALAGTVAFERDVVSPLDVSWEADAPPPARGLPARPRGTAGSAAARGRTRR